MEEAEHKSKVTLHGDFKTFFTKFFLPSVDFKDSFCQEQELQF